jgi:long-chain acyl-CoA synthetase
MSENILPANTLFEAFLVTANRDPGGIAWLAANPNETQPEWTWSELRDGVRMAVAYLYRHGVRSGDRVANLGRNSAQWAILDLACSAIGAIHAPIDVRYPIAWITECLTSLDASMVFGDRSPPNDQDIDISTPFPKCIPLASLCERLPTPGASSISKYRNEMDANDPACILFTSGTTQRPRGVLLSHRNLLSNGLAKLDAMPQAPNDIRLNLLPFAHAYARTCELTTWILAGGTMACAYGIQSALAQSSTLRPQLINGVPLFYEDLRQNERARDILQGSIRRFASGGAPLKTETRSWFQQLGFPVFQGYGLTETSPVVCSNRDSSANEAPILDGVGPAVEGVQTKIDSQRRLWVTGNGVMLGYWRDPSATSLKIVDGWLDTGDLASSHSQWGRAVISIEGRTDDLQVLASGYKFSPRPLELRLISEIDAIQNCVLVGTARHRPLLAVQLAPGFEDSLGDEILGRAREVLYDIEEHARPAAVWIEPRMWSVENGCLHWKGGVNRQGVTRRIEASGSA